MMAKKNYCSTHDELKHPDCPVCETGIKEGELIDVVKISNDHEVVSKLVDGKLEVIKVVFFSHLESSIAGSTELVGGRQPITEWWPIDDRHWLEKPVPQKSRWWS
jgi:hypothetical protein